MTYADASTCPSCRSRRIAAPRCPRCGFDFDSPLAREIWETLSRADALVLRARTPEPVQPARSAPVPPAPAPRTPVPPPPAAEPFAYRPYPAPQAVPAGPGGPGPQARPTSDAPGWSVGSILLGLAAVGLVVAGIVFVTQSWDSVGLTARTLVLGAVTASVTALAVWVTRRGLRASAEAVWPVAVLLVVVDAFAARHTDLLGLGAVSVPWMVLVVGVGTTAAGAGIVLLGRRLLAVDLVAPSVLCGLGTGLAGIGAATVPDGWRYVWCVALGGLVAGLLGLAVRPARASVAAVVARVVVVLFFVQAYVASVVEAVGHPSAAELVEDTHGLALLVASLGSLAIAAAVAPLRLAGTALAVVGACTLVVLPCADEWPDGGGAVAVAVLALILAAGAVRGGGAWLDGLRIGSVPVLAGLTFLAVAWLAMALGGAAGGWEDAGTGAATDRLRLLDVPEPDPLPLVAVALATVAVVPLLGRWPAIGLVPTVRRTSTLAAGASFLWAVVVLLGPPLWVVPAVLTPAVVALVRFGRREDPLARGATAAALATAAAITVVPSGDVLGAALIVASLVGVAGALQPGPTAWRQVHGGAAVLLGAGGLAAVAGTRADSGEVAAFCAFGVAAGSTVVAATLLRGSVPRPGIEVGAALAAVVPLVAGGAGPLTVRWSVAGVVLLSLAAVCLDRRWYVVPGAAALLVAYVIAISTRGVTSIEAVTVPIGAVALGVGIRELVRRPGLASWASIGPGVVILAAPSLPQACADPAEVRALALAAAAVVAVALGVRFRLQAPFVVGVVVVAILFGFSVVPYLVEIRGVVLLAGASVVLGALGITWEDRVADGRQAVRYVRDLR